MEIASYMHLKLNGGRVTAAVGIVKKGTSEIAYVGMAFCSPEDQFCRKRGRLIATGRLNKGKHFFKLVLVPDVNVSEQVRHAIQSRVSSGYEELPDWVLNYKKDSITRVKNNSNTRVFWV